jgi:glyoxylase-like metal-dependent hydrolase (beta-lactamase superfamily II)
MRGTIGLAAALCVLPGAQALAQFGAAPAELRLIKVMDDVYVINNDVVPGNITVLVTDEGVLLVDTKFAIDYDNVAAMLAEVTDQPIKYVINTHYHDDHSGSNQVFQSDGASVFAAENARLKMINAGRSQGLPNVTVEDSARLYIGDTEVALYYFGRAHTDGDIVVHFPDHGLMATGDIFAYGPATPELVDYAGGGSAREWPRTLTRALELEFETVVPGHGEVVTRSQMETFRDDTARLAEMVQSMRRQGRPRADIEAMLRSEFSFADFHVQMSLDGLMVELQ